MYQIRSPEDVLLAEVKSSLARDIFDKVKGKWEHHDSSKDNFIIEEDCSVIFGDLKMYFCKGTYLIAKG